MKEVLVRRFEELDVFFIDKATIWVVPKYASSCIIYHRWFSPPLGSWEQWRRFKQKLMLNKKITIQDCYHWAIMHGIESKGTLRKPDEKQFKFVEKLSKRKEST